MSAYKFKKYYLVLPLISALLIGVVVWMNYPSDEHAQLLKAKGNHSDAVVAAELATADKANAVTHPDGCTHCSSPSVDSKPILTSGLPSKLSTRAQLDPIFKAIALDQVSFNREKFDFLVDSQIGQRASFAIAGQEFNGSVSLIREGTTNSSYAISFPSGDMTVTIGQEGEVEALLMFDGDSRIVKIAAVNSKQPRLVRVVHGGAEKSPELIATEVKVSDVFCAPEGATYPLSAPQPDTVGALVAPNNPNVDNVNRIGIDPLKLDHNPSASHVLYLDFDGERVEDDFWNVYSKIDSIEAAPALYMSDDDWVENVWKRVVEDFAPFDLRITTDRSIYDSALEEERLHVIITTTDLVYPGTGGASYRGSYQTNNTRIVWVFNQEEYFCASTISHEAGHAFGLQHDGPGPSPAYEYYGGHNDGYSYGWAPIMGAFYNDEGSLFIDEVNQWSRGEFYGAYNMEDDLAIIAGNGFGFVEDDFGDEYDAPNVGVLALVGQNQLGGSGLISSTNDVDVFKFTAIAGDATFTVLPLDVASEDDAEGSSTQGANLAVGLRLLDSNGNEVVVGTPSGETDLAATITETLVAAVYYLEVTGAGRGTNGEDGFTDYASLGQYTIVGNLPTPLLSVLGSQPEVNDKTGEVSPGPLNVPVLSGDTQTDTANGTNYGFSYVGNSDPSKVHTFRLENSGDVEITNIEVSLSGNDFEVVSALVDGTLPVGASDTIQIAYVPKDNGINGVDHETVTIRYTAGVVTEFQFPVSGLSTQSPTNDNYASNHEPNAAHDLSNQEGIWLSNYQGLGFFRPSFPTSPRADYFKFTTPNYKLITINVDYSGSAGVVSFELRAKRGGTYYSVGSTTATDGKISFLLNDDQYGSNVAFVVKVSIDPVSPNDNYYSYDLSWTAQEIAGNGDDFYEGNDTQEEAFNLDGASSTTLSEYLGKGILNNDDWYKITVPRDVFVRMLHVRADFVHADGDINIEMFDESGGQFFSNNRWGSLSRYLAVSDSAANDYEVISWHNNVKTEDYADNWSPTGQENIVGVAPGVYYIRVYGDNAGNEYDLAVNMLADDAYEIFDEDSGFQNDAYTTATELGDSVVGDNLVGHWLSDVNGIGVLASYPEGSSEQIFIMSNDEDWYKVTPANVSSLNQMTFYYQATAGNVQGGLVPAVGFRVYDPNFVEVATNITQLSGGGTSWSVVGSIDLENPNSAYYYVKVFNFPEKKGLLISYDFMFFASTEPSDGNGGGIGDEDSYSPNHAFNEPYDLSRNAGKWLSTIDGKGIQLKADWYSIRIPEGAFRLEVLCNLNSSLGNMDLVLSRNGVVPLSGQDDGTGPQYSNSGDSLEIIWEDPEPGLFTITVLGDNNGNEYDLFWDVSAQDDNYEDNNSKEMAFDLTGHEKAPLSKLDGYGRQLNADWYRIEVTAPAAELRVDTYFSHDEGDIDIELFSENGFSYKRSISSTDDESIVMADPIPGTYYVKVFYGNAGNRYDLIWGAYTQAELDAIDLPDVYEPNNDSQSATLLEPHIALSELSGLATQADEDWYAIHIDENSVGLRVDCIFTHADGDIDLELYSADNLISHTYTGSALLVAKSTDDNEVIDFEGSLAAGTYYIRVLGANQGNTYDLFWVDYIKDAFEPNNSKADAYDLESLERAWLSVEDEPVQGDDDWYRIPVDAENSILVVELKEPLAKDSIAFEIYDSSESVTPLASVSPLGETKYLQLPLTTAGDYYIRVFGTDEYFAYDLFWNSSVQDSFEDNDLPLEAADVSGGTGSAELVLFDEDWYFIESPLGDVRVDVGIVFQHVEGDLNLVVYDEGLNIIDQSLSDSDGESVSFEVNPLGGKYYFFVSTPDNYYGTPYTLNWSSGSIIDNYEDNNVVRVAHDLSGNEGVWLEDVNGYATQLDDDWYQIVVSDGATSLSIDLEFVHSAGDMDLELYQLVAADPLDVTNPSWDQRVTTFVASSTTSTDNEQIVVDVTGAPGIYFVRVFGGESGNTGNGYRLLWNDGVEDAAGDQAYLDEEWVFLDGGVGPPAPLVQPQANADGDIFPNWAEFALVLNTDFQDTVDIHYSSVEINGKEYFSISFVRAVEARKRGYQFYVEESATLPFDGGLSVFHSSEYLGDGIERVTYRSSSDIRDMKECFFKIRVEPPTSGY